MQACPQSNTDTHNAFEGVEQSSKLWKVNKWLASDKNT